MRVLWIVNMMMPDIQKKYEYPLLSSGWWLDTMAKKLASSDGVELVILSLALGVSEEFQEEINGVLYYVVPVSFSDRQIKPSLTFSKKLAQYVQEIHPDIIHIQGTELTTNQVVYEQKNIPVVVSIQGLISEIVKKDYSYPELKFWFSPLDYLKEKLKHFKNKRRAKSEIWQLKQADYVIGRTLWDRTHTFFHNQNAKYFYLQECIRESFLENTWDISKTEPYTIFCAGGLSNPLKGFHKIVEAASYLVKEFPDLKLKVCGNFRKGEKIGYHHYLKKWIQKLGMQEHIEFLGSLDEKAMCESFLTSRMYVMGSAIENSPNTLGEAMCLGVPSVVPFVGGVPSLVTDEKEALFYRYDDTLALAYQMRRILLNNTLAECLGNNAKERSETQYATENLAENLAKIYQTILDENSK